MPRLSPPLSRAQPPDWMKPLRDADRSLRNFINPPLSRVRAWQGSMGDAQISARPVRAAGEKITPGTSKSVAAASAWGRLKQC